MTATVAEVASTEVMDGMDAATPAGSDVAIAPWEDPPRTPAWSSHTAPVLAVDGFAGPLDWWLEMARAQKIDLGQLSILALVEAFATALEAALVRSEDARQDRPSVNPSGSVALGRWGDWLVMAATLTLLRSRLLLPPNAPEAQTAAKDAALQQTLLRRVQLAAAADWLERRGQLGRDVFRRGDAPAPTSGRVGDLTELLRACLLCLQLPPDIKVYQPRPFSLWRPGDARALIVERLPTLPPGNPLAAFLPVLPADAPSRARRCRSAVASTLLASLELARGGHLTLEQDEGTAPIRVFPVISLTD